MKYRSALSQALRRPLLSHSSPRARGVRWIPSVAQECQSQQGYAAISAAKLQFGQPVYETHPHLLKPGEVTPGISAQEYHERRARLAANLPDGGIAILAAADTKYRSASVFYEFFQDSNFFYLTGFNEPEAVAIIQKTATYDYEFHLFVRPKDIKAEQWDGARSGKQAALDVWNADHTGDVAHLATLLPPIIANATEIWLDGPEIWLDGPESKSSFARFFSGQETSVGGFRKMINEIQGRVRSLRPLLNDLRVVKSEAEVANMRLAGKISGRAFTNAMRQRWTKEKDLSAFLEYDFKIGGCDAQAYVPVVAGGKNALSIHYVRNDNVFKEDDLVLVDAGGQVGGYITDITRTWPVSGKFSDAQRDLYETILEVQRSSVSLCRASADLSLDKIHKITDQGLRDGLTRLGFDLAGNAMDILFPHHVGHYIGLDVHDSPGYPRSGNLRAGQCVTIEPGIYVPDDERWPEHFRGIGIRIEDSICVQEDGPLVLTTEAVKEVVDIEALRD